MAWPIDGTPDGRKPSPTMKTNSVGRRHGIILGSTFLLMAHLSQAGTLQFSGAAYVSAGAAAGLKITGTSLTLEAWVNPTLRGSDATEGGIILGREGEYVLTRYGDGTLRYAVATTTPGWTWITTGYVLPTNQWTHVALTYDGSSFTVYVNGVIRALTGGAGTIGDADAARNDFMIGNRQLAARYFYGQIDEVRIWNVARTGGEIAAAMNQPLRGDETGLLAYYQFNEGFGTTTADSTGHGLTGTLINNPLWDPASEPVQMPVVFNQPSPLLNATTARLHARVATNGVPTTNAFWLSSRSSTALSFDGINDAVSFTLGPNHTYNLLPLTVTAWIKTDRTGGNAGIVNKYVAGSLSGWQMNLINGQLRAFYFRNGNTNVFGGGDGLNGGNVDDGNWHHAAFTVGAGGGKLYVDGLLTSTMGWTGIPAVTTNTVPVRLGVYGTSWFAGQLDEITIWNAELSAEAIASLMTTPPTPAHPQYASLAAHWPLDEGDGVYVNDATGRNSAGLVTGEPQWVRQARPDAYAATPALRVTGTNGVLNLDGVDDHVRVPGGIWFSNEFTIEAWVYEHSYNTYSRLIDFGNGAPSDNVLLALTDSTTGRPTLSVYRGASGQSVTAPNPLPLNQWVHLAATLRSNVGTIYVNGVAAAFGTVTGPNATNRTLNYIGRSNWAPPIAGDGYANAIFDEVRIWKVARSAADLRQSMWTPVAPDDPNLVLNYRMDDPPGLTVVDYRPTSPRNGVMTNGASRLAFEQLAADWPSLPGGTRQYFSSVASSANGTAYGPVEGLATPTTAAGTALVFNGTNTSVSIGSFGSAMPTTNVTVEFWQRTHSLRIQSTFGLEPDNSANRFQAHLPYVDGVIYWDFGNTAGGGRLSYTPPVSLVGTWQHFALVAKSPPNGYMRIYRNGILEAQAATASTFTVGARDLVIGRLGAINLDGELDEFRIWNAARDGADIQRDYNRRLVGNESGLVAYYRMDDGAGVIVTDATGRGRDGLLINAPAWVPSPAPVGWPIVTTADVADIVLGDVTMQGTIKGDPTADTRLWIEQGRYVPVPGTADNHFYGYTIASSVSSINQINFDALPVREATFGTIAFTSSGGPPEWPGGPVDYWAVRYVGRIFLPAAGDYTFYTASDDGSQLFIDGQLVVTNDGVRAIIERGAVIRLTAGYHWLDARMFESFSGASFYVSYAGPGIPKQVIPPETFLRHDLIYSPATLPVTYSAAIGPQGFSSLATNLDTSGSYVLRVAVANANGTNYGPVQPALMGSKGAFTELFLNGVAAHVAVPDGTNALAFPGTDPFTLEAWLKPSRLGSTQTVVAKFNQPNPREYFLALNPAGRIVFHRQGSDYVSTQTAPSGVYTHVAATYDGAQRRIYVNGVLDPAVDPGSPPITNWTAPFLIGARYWSNAPADFFQGAIDDLRVWQVARSQIQIVTDLNRRLSGFELGLIAYYRFDEAQGDLAEDSSPYGNTGVFRNNPAFVPGGQQFVCDDAPPILNIETLDFAPGVILWWPITCNEYILEEATIPNAPPDAWVPVFEPVTPVGESYLMVVLWDRYEDGFFRLRRR